jgi:hypothetical protein
MNTRNVSPVLPAIYILLVPTVAHANAGSALMWTQLLYMVWGNAVIGIGEGLILCLWFRLSPWRAIPVVILANYASGWIGGQWIVFLRARYGEPTLENTWMWILFFLALAFLVTLLIELPFFRFAVRKRLVRWRPLLGAVVLIHLASYALLVAAYSRVSHVSLLTDLDVVSPQAMPGPEEYALRYTNAEGLRIARAGLTSGIESVQTEQEEQRLRPWDVEVFHSDSAWSYSSGYWASDGIRGENTETGATFHFALETPFVTWYPSYPTVIADEYVVLQWGADQIFLLHPPTRRISLIARGREPSVIPLPE